MFERILGAMALLVATYSVLAVARPGLRARWKGTGVRAGAVSNGGFALAFGGIGVFFICQDRLTQPWRGVLGAAMMIGFALVFCGRALDMGWMRPATGAWQESRRPPDRLLHFIWLFPAVIFVYLVVTVVLRALRQP